MKTAQYAAIGLAMIGVVRLTALLPVRFLMKLVLEIVAGAGFFVLCCAVYWTKANDQMYEIFFRPLLRKKGDNGCAEESIQTEGKRKW